MIPVNKSVDAIAWTAKTCHLQLISTDKANSSSVFHQSIFCYDIKFKLMRKLKLLSKFSAFLILNEF
jgi:hypothetical protein